MARSAPRRIVAACLALGLLGVLPARAHGQDIRAFEEGFFELFVERIPDRVPVIALVDAAGQVLLPLRAILDHVGIPVADEGGRLVLEWPPGVWRTVVDPATGTVEAGGAVTTGELSEWARQGGESFVSARLLGSVLAARVEVRWAELLVVVSGGTPFPATTRLELAARRARERLQASRLGQDAFAGLPYPSRTGGFAAGWGVALAETGGLSRGTVRGTLGGSVLGGGLETGATGVFVEGQPGDVADVFGRYTRAFSETWLRRVQAGSVLSDGTLARRIVGVTLTNHPFTTPQYFGEAMVTPAVPAGWDYEVYQGEHLVGVSTADNPQEIRTPLNYGNTPVRIRMIGPAGQVIEEDLVYVLPAGRAPPGSLRYSVGGGVCQEVGCDSYYFGELTRGWTSWLTTSLGADRLDVGSGSAPVRPYASLGASPHPSLATELLVREAFWRTNLQYLAGARGALSAAYTWAGVGAVTGGVPGWTAQATASGAIPVFGGRWMSARLLLRGFDQGEVDSWQASVATNVRRTHLAVDLESGLQAGTLTTLRVFQTLGRRGFLRDLALHGAIGARSSELVLGELGATFRTAQGPVVDARVRLREREDAVFTLGVSLRSGMGFFQARGSHGGGTEAFLSGDGGLAWGPGAGLVALPYQSVGRGGVYGDVFYDFDGDGVRGEGEPAVEGTTVSVGGHLSVTDEEGRFRSWEATPYEALVVALDSLSLDFDWAPSEREVHLRPSPNIFSRVSLAVHPTRAVVGSVVTSDSPPQPLGGVRVEILDAAGDVVAEERTFSDGVFYIARMRPGRYVLRVAPSSMGALGGGPPPRLDVDVPGGAGAEIELPPLVVGSPSR